MADLWQTPPDLMAFLHDEFQFTLEVCADADRRAIPSIPYMGLDNDLSALDHDWGPIGSVNYCNPPYSQLPAFVDEAATQATLGRHNVLLIPAYTDTKYFQDIIAEVALEIRFLKGRLRFWENGKPGKDTARFPSSLVIFSPLARLVSEPITKYWDWKTELQEAGEV